MNVVRYNAYRTAGLKHREAVLLDEIVYRADKQGNTGWGTNTRAWWGKLTKLTQKQLRGGMDRLSELRLIEKHICHAKGAKATSLKALVTDTDQIAQVLQLIARPQGDLLGLSDPRLSGPFVPLQMALWAPLNSQKGHIPLIYVEKEIEKEPQASPCGPPLARKNLHKNAGKNLAALGQTMIAEIDCSHPITEISGVITKEGMKVNITETVLGLNAKKALNKSRVLTPKSGIKADSRSEIWTLYRKLMEIKVGVKVNVSPAKADWGYLANIVAIVAEEPGLTAHELLLTVIQNWGGFRQELKDFGKTWLGTDRPSLSAIGQNAGLAWSFAKAIKSAVEAPLASAAPIPPPKAVKPAQQAPVKVLGDDMPHPAMSISASAAFFEDARVNLFYGDAEKTKAHWIKKGWPLVPQEISA